MSESRPTGQATSGPTTEAAPSDTRQEVNTDELLDLLRRERADFQNFKRRVSQERVVDREIAQGEVIARLLPLLDDLDRAFAQRPPDLATHPWAEGVQMLRRQLEASFRELGVERIGAPGEEFDPERHEAVMFVPEPHARTSTVRDVERPGYRLRGRLLRPARVSVVGPADQGHSATRFHDGSSEPARKQRGPGESHSSNRGGGPHGAAPA